MTAAAVSGSSRQMAARRAQALSLALCGALALWAALDVAAQHTDAPTPLERLHALFDTAWEQQLRDNPEYASSTGDHRYDSQWSDPSTEAVEARTRRDREILAQLAQIDRAALPEGEQLNYDIFARRYRERIGLARFRPDLYDIKPREGLQTLSELAETLPFASVADYEHWTARLRAVGVLVDRTLARLEIGVREQRTQPRSIMQRLLPQIAQQIPERPEQSPFYAPFLRMPESVPVGKQLRLREAGLAAIREVVIPAYRRFQSFFLERYLPACRAGDGVWDTPQGDEFYRALVAMHTTTTLSPEQIHEIGLREVARIRVEMDRVIERVGFKGGFAAFLEFLRTDPRFYYRTPQELFEAYAALAKRIDPQLVTLFGRLPRLPYGVRAIPMTSAPNTTTAYYMPGSLDGTRAGYFYVNLYRPEMRPRYEMAVLTMHEAVPGHHLQIALGQELTGLPKFRRDYAITAFVEGWGLYAEGLGEEIGMYADPYEEFGRLTYDMWRAVRLVVDTGIHAKHWTRSQAIDYFKSNAAKTDADIVNEVDRYISWPGQALAYKIGQLRILELRAQAQQRLGAKFDLREFHDQVLARGALPLDDLSAVIHRWIDERAR